MKQIDGMPVKEDVYQLISGNMMVPCTQRYSIVGGKQLTVVEALEIMAKQARV